MNEGEAGIILLVVIAVSVSILWHQRIKNYHNANIRSAITTVVIFHLVAYIVDGELSALVGISIVVAFFVSFFISAAVGGIMKNGGSHADSGDDN